MLLKKRVKGGVLIYALLMSAVFTLLLQFYLSRLVAAQEQIVAMEASNKAYLMAHLTQKNRLEARGQLQFSEGHSLYEEKQEQLLVTVALKTGQTFTYRFPQAEALKKEKGDTPQTSPQKETTEIRETAKKSEIPTRQEEKGESQPVKTNDSQSSPAKKD